MRLKYKTRFDVDYPEKMYNYYTSEGPNQKIKIALLNASNYYCMYCGTDLYNDNKLFCNLEHSVEKSQKEKEIPWLRECKYNLSVTCPTCNIKHKKIVKPLVTTLDELSCSQLNYSCRDNGYCSFYKTVLEEALNTNNIILQPFGASNKYTSNCYEVEYDLLRNRYSCSQEYLYTSYEFTYIRDHISRFNLNGVSKTPVIEKICCDIIEDIQLFNVTETKFIFLKYLKIRYSNILGKTFIDFLNSSFENKSIQELEDFCEFILISSYL